MELDKSQTKIIKGISIIAMLLLHLFCRYDYKQLYTPLLYIRDVPLVFLFAQLSDFCVMGFAFCSGYAHFIIYKKTNNMKKFYKRRLHSLLDLYINYWVVLIIFCIISMIIGKSHFMPGSFFEFFLNFTSVEVTYNGAWWYLFIFAIIVIASPIIMLFLNKSNFYLITVCLFLVYTSAFFVRFHTPGHGWLLEKYGTFGMTVVEYAIGCIAVKYKWFSFINDKIVTKWSSKKRWIFSGIIIFAMLLFRTFVIRSLFVAPFTGFIIICIVVFNKMPKVIENIILFLSKHSTNIWLIHMFFFSGLFVNFVFIAKYPALIYLLMLALCLLVSFGVEFILRHAKLYLTMINRKITKK